MKDFSGGDSGNTTPPNGPSNPNNSGNNGIPPDIMQYLGNIPGMADQAAVAIDPTELMINYNERFANAGPTLFRDSIVQQTLAILIGKNKPNALLIGPPGVGKTKIAEDIAYRIVSNDPIIPDKLKKTTIYELPLSNIMMGTKYRGDLEKKLKTVVDFLSDPANDAIVFIDEIHVLAGRDEEYKKIAQILKPALARGDIRVIGATTTQEEKIFNKDPALSRRFSRVIVDEFSKDQTVEILKNLRLGFTMHYGNRVVMPDALFESVVNIADEYSSSNSHRPDNAITLLDRACGEAVINRKLMEEMAKADPALLAALNAQPLIQITEKQVKRTAIRIMTGNTKKADFDVDRTRDVMLSKLRGQDEVIEQVLKLLHQYDLDLFPKRQPMTMLFAGNSGVGKTEMAKIIAQELTGEKPIILNMTEYHDAASINRIIGSPDGYVGSDSNHELPFDILSSNPYRIVLLDEFEKGNPAVQRLFMSAFDEGYIKTNRGKTVDFSRTIIIATTNAGHTRSTPQIGFTENAGGKKSDIKTLEKSFDIALLNRFTDTIKFNSLSQDAYREILANMYHTEAARITAERPRIKLPADMPDADLDELVEETYMPELGARPAQRTIWKYIENHV